MTREDSTEESGNGMRRWCCRRSGDRQSAGSISMMHPQYLSRVRQTQHGWYYYTTPSAPSLQAVQRMVKSGQSKVQGCRQRQHQIHVAAHITVTSSRGRVCRNERPANISTSHLNQSGCRYYDNGLPLLLQLCCCVSKQ